MLGSGAFGSVYAFKINGLPNNLMAIKVCSFYKENMDFD
jgi:hypothetical protein